MVTLRRAAEGYQRSRLASANWCTVEESVLGKDFHPPRIGRHRCLGSLASETNRYQCSRCGNLDILRLSTYADKEWLCTAPSLTSQIRSKHGSVKLEAAFCCGLETASQVQSGLKGCAFSGYASRCVRKISLAHSITLFDTFLSRITKT